MSVVLGRAAHPPSADFHLRELLLSQSQSFPKKLYYDIIHILYNLMSTIQPFLLFSISQGCAVITIVTF